MEVKDADGSERARDLWKVKSGDFKLEHYTNAIDQATFKKKARKALEISCLAMEES